MNISEQQIRGVKIRMECRGTEDIQKESLYLEISDTGKVQASHDGNSDQTIMVLVPVGMAFLDFTVSDSKFLDTVSSYQKNRNEKPGWRSTKGCNNARTD